MSVPSIECSLPFCGIAKEQTNFSCNFRITTVILGVIFLIAGLTLISGAFGSFEFVSGVVCTAIGLVAIAIGSCMRCVTQNEENDIVQNYTSNLSSLPYTPPKSNFLPYTPPKIDGIPSVTNTQIRSSVPPLESVKAAPIVSIKQLLKQCQN